MKSIGVFREDFAHRAAFHAMAAAGRARFAVLGSVWSEERTRDEDRASKLGRIIANLRRSAALGLALLLVAVSPDLRVALTGGTVEGMPSAAWYYWARLPVQLVFIAWVLRAGDVFSQPPRHFEVTGNHRSQ